MRLYLLTSLLSLILAVASLPIADPSLSSDSILGGLAIRGSGDHFDLHAWWHNSFPDLEARDDDAELLQDRGDFNIAHDFEMRATKPSVQDPPLVYMKDVSISGEGELHPRLVGAIVEGAQAVAEVVMAIVNHIKEKIEKDKSARSAWTQWLVQECRKKKAKWDFLVVHVKHKMKCIGQRGRDWFHKHFEFKNTNLGLGTTTGYELYGFRKGADFERKGDGGYLNWAYTGHVKSKAKGGAVVHFGPAS